MSFSDEVGYGFKEVDYEYDKVSHTLINIFVVTLYTVFVVFMTLYVIRSDVDQQLARSKALATHNTVELMECRELLQLSGIHP